jgi:hypothetical protein
MELRVDQPAGRKAKMSLQHGGVECKTRETERQGDRFALGPSQRVAGSPQSDPCLNPVISRACSPKPGMVIPHDLTPPPFRKPGRRK